MNYCLSERFIRLTESRLLLLVRLTGQQFVYYKPFILNIACDYMYKVYQPVIEPFKKETKSKQRRITILNDGVLIQRNELGHSSDYNERAARHLGNLGPGCNTLLLRLIPRDLYNACPHRQFHTLYSNMALSTVTLDYQPRTLKGLSQIVPGARSASKYCYLSHIIYLTVRAPGLICESPLMLVCQAEGWVGSSYCFIMVFGIMRPGREPMTSCMRDGHAYHYNPPPLPTRSCSNVGWLVVFNVPSTAGSFRDGTPI